MRKRFILSVSILLLLVTVGLTGCVELPTQNTTGTVHNLAVKDITIHFERTDTNWEVTRTLFEGTFLEITLERKGQSTYAVTARELEDDSFIDTVFLSLDVSDTGFVIFVYYDEIVIQ